MDHRDAVQAYTLAFIEWRIAAQAFDRAVDIEINGGPEADHDVERAKVRLFQADSALRAATDYFRRTASPAPSQPAGH